MIRQLLILTLITLPLTAMEQLFKKFKTSPFNDELFALVEQEDATAKQVDELVGKGAEVNSTNINSVTPLMKAAQTGNATACKALIDKGALVSTIVDEYWAPSLVTNGLSALHFAASFGHPQVSKLLLKHGADIFLTTDFYSSPLKCCISTQLEEFHFYKLTIAERDQKITDGSFKETYKTLVKHAWALPEETEDAREILKRMATAYLSLKEKLTETGQPFSKELIPYILQSNQELRDHICALLLPSIRSNKQIPPCYTEVMAQCIYQSTVKKIFDTLMKIREHSDSEKFDAFAKPKFIELEYGDDIMKNIGKRIDNPPTEYSEQKSSLISSIMSWFGF